MADATAIGIVGIVVSGVVGPAVAGWIAARRAARDHERARILADRAEARTLLDGAEGALFRAGRLRDVAQSAFISHASSIREKAPRVLDEFHETAREADTFDARLGIRFTREHEIVVAYHAAIEALLSASRAIGISTDMGEHADIRESWDSLKQSREDFEAAHDRFVAAAQAAVGTQLELRASASPSRADR